jgi:hypothetical protein
MENFEDDGGERLEYHLSQSGGTPQAKVSG